MHAHPDDLTSQPDSREIATLWRLRSDAPALAVCVFAGLLISLLPHLLAWCETGHPDWVADHDERFYLAVGSQAYFNHPSYLADPVRVSGGPSLYKPLPLLPGVWLARAGNFGPLAVGIGWRIFAGVTIGAAWYLLLRQRFQRPWLATALALILLADGGLIEARPVFRQAKTIVQLTLGHAQELFIGKPLLHPEWRISTPGVTMAFLLVFFWAMARLHEKPSTARVVLAGVTYGILFYVYFYYWTAVGLGLLIAIGLDKGHRRDTFFVGLLGTIVGLPSVISDILLKRSTAADWLERSNKFMSIGRFDDLLAPKVIVALMPILLGWILWRHKDLIFLWALGLAGLILSNHQIITKLQIENFHWCYVWGPVLSLVFVILAVREVAGFLSKKCRPWVAEVGLILLAIGMYGSGIWLRGVEASRSRNCRENAQVLAEYRALPARSASALVANSVVAGEINFVDYAVILDNLRPLYNYSTILSPTVTNIEWEERMALGAILEGFDRAGFEVHQRKLLEETAWGPWSRDETKRKNRLDARLDAFDHIQINLASYLNKYAVRYVALPTAIKPPYLSNGWTRVETGPTWDVWERSIADHVSP